jgi:AcrR family transcriptional regulator
MSVELPSKRLTHAERKQQTRERLLAAAAQMFAERGYSDTSVDAVAEKAGYSKGAVYSNFADKEDLLFALVEKHCDEMLAAIANLFGGPGSLEERLRRIADLFIEGDEMLRTRSLLLFELAILAVRNPDLGARYAEFYEQVGIKVALLLEEEAARQGGSLPAPSRQLASAVLGLGDGLILQQLVDPTRSGADAYMTTLHLILGAASNDEPRPPA